MAYYIIIEVDEGYQVAEVPDGSSAESVAKDAGGILTDDGPYDTFAQAEDTLATLPNPYEEDVRRPL